MSVRAFRYLFAALALGVPAAAQGVHTFTINAGQSNFVWTGDTSTGPLEGDPSNTFHLEGYQNVSLGFGSSGLSDAGFISGDAAVVPDIHAKIPNPISWLPDLADIDITNMHLSFSSVTDFPVNGSGNYTASVVVTVLSGTMIVDPLVGSTIVEDMAGTVSNPNDASGTLVISGTNANLHVPVDNTTTFDDSGSGMSGWIRLQGDIVAQASCSGGVTTYCYSFPNTSGGTADLMTSGSTSVSANDLTLMAGPMPNQWGIFYYGPGMVNGGGGAVFGEGVRCVGGSPHRLPPRLASFSILSYTLDLANPPSVAGTITPGSSWNFQAWFRDPPGGSSGFNLSNAATIDFCF
ncbi:MAG: hypothetical protein CMJ87_12650 [Planctomycetes bacterium]|nr:hypothetical protein [Planctomycetota bacterium]